MAALVDPFSNSVSKLIDFMAAKVSSEGSFSSHISKMLEQIAYRANHYRQMVIGALATMTDAVKDLTEILSKKE